MNRTNWLITAPMLLLPACAEPEGETTSAFSATSVTSASGGASLGLSTVDPSASASASASASTSASSTSEGESESESVTDSDTEATASTDSGDTEAINTDSDSAATDSDSSSDSSSDSDATTGDSDSDTDTDTDNTTGEQFPDGAVFVHAALGLDSNPGTAAAPKRSIQAGISAAAELPEGSVHVAQGTYEVDYQNNKYITLVDGVSLYGGYKADDWEARDVELYASIILDKSGSAGTAAEPNRAVDGGVGVGPGTVVDGFTIRGGAGQFAAAVRVLSSAPTFTRNRILGGIAPGLTSYGVWIESSKANFTYNRIEAGDAPGLNRGYGVYCPNKCEGVFDGNYIDGGAGSYSYGAFFTSSSASLYNNVINGGAGTSNVYAVYLNGSAGVLANNTILTDQPNLGYGVFVSSTLSPARVENNIITATPYCIYEGSASSKLASAKNNDLFCTYAARTGWDGKTHTEMIPMEASFKSGGAMASGNIKLAPTFVNQNGGDFRLKAGGDTFCDLSLGGLELTNLFTLDRDAAARTKPWSVGAHELDGACK